MATYRSMLDLKIPSREAASLTGVSRTTANRKPAPPRDHAPVVPQNKLSSAERAGILAALQEFFLNTTHPTRLEHNFTVVWWEQRGAGMSYG